MRRYRSKDDSFVASVEKADGQKIICRIYEQPVPAYMAIVGLSLPELPAVYDYSEHDTLTVIEEEFIDGIPLSQLLELYHPDTSQTAAICLKVCRALSVLHENGLIHRDVKPENVLVSSSGRVCLIDLDVSSVHDPNKERDTSLLGTAGYAAPEQFGFGRSDVRTDIFSMGVMMNVMLTGFHPSRLLASGELRPIIEKCIEVNADKRYHSAFELGEKLRQFASPDSICQDCGYVSPGGGCLCCGKPSRSSRKRRRRFILPVIAAVIAVILLAILLPGKNTEAPESMPEMNSPSPAVEPTPSPTPSPSPTPTPTPEPVDPVLAEYGGEWGPFTWLPTETSTIAQTEIKQLESVRYENGNYFFENTANEMLGHFLYDLDGNGTDEIYYLSVTMSNESPRHFTPFDSVGRPFNEDDWVWRFAAPVVFKRVAAGEYEPVKEMTDKLENARIELRWIHLPFGDETDMPSVFRAPPLDDEWENTVYIKYYLHSIGVWAVTAHAEIDGQPLMGYCITQLRSDWNGIELEEN